MKQKKFQLRFQDASENATVRCTPGRGGPAAAPAIFWQLYMQLQQ